MKTELHKILAELVEHYGGDDVFRALQEVRYGKNQVRKRRKRENIGISKIDDTSDERKSSKPIPTAVGFVEKLNITADRSREITILARQFDSKKFLPNFGEIRNFCEIYRLKLPLSKSRVSAIPVVFRFLESLDSVDLKKLLFESAHSGPSELGPIADAIRGRSKIRSDRGLASSDKLVSISTTERKESHSLQFSEKKD